MILPVIIGVSGLILFFVPDTFAKNNEAKLKENKNLSYPYQYHKNDILFPSDIKNRVKFIHFSTGVLFGEFVKIFDGSQPILPIGLTLPTTNFTQIEQTQADNTLNFSVKNLLQFADFYDENYTY